MIEAGHGPHIRCVERGQDAGEIIRRRNHVAIAKNQDRVPGFHHHVDEVRDLAVGAVAGGIDHEVDGDVRVAGAQRLDHGDGGIVCALDAAEKLDRAGIVLGEEAFQVFQEAGLGAMERLEQGYGVGAFGWCRTCGEEATEHDCGGKHVEGTDRPKRQQHPADDGKT